MTDLSNFSDRDLLVILLTRFDNLEREFREFKTEMKDELAQLADRVTNLERVSDTQKGFFRGMDFVRQMVASLPPAAILGAAGVLLGKSR